MDLDFVYESLWIVDFTAKRRGLWILDPSDAPPPPLVVSRHVCPMFNIVEEARRDKSGKKLFPSGEVREYKDY